MGIPGGRGGLGIGTVIILGLVGWALGIDPRLLIGGAEMVAGGRGGGQVQQQGRQGTSAVWQKLPKPSLYRTADQIS